MDKIKIAGAGPAGLSAAINLAKAGFEVEVFESGKDCGHRFGGDLQGFEAKPYDKDVIKDLADMNIKINFDCDPFNECILMTDERQCTMKMDTPLYLFKRGPFKGTLDTGLKEQAVDSGVRITFNRTMPKEEANIIATGPAGKEIFAVDKGIVFETSMENHVVCLVDDKAHVKAYAYMLVTNGYGCMCTMLAGQFQKLNACFDSAKKIFEKHFDPDIRNPKAVGGVATFSLKNEFQSGGKLYVGEAAGLQDMFLGFGIRRAITSGYLASKSIIENKNYQELATEYFESRLKNSMVSRFMQEIFGNNLTYNFIINSINSSKGKSRILSAINGRDYSYNKLLYRIALGYLSRRYKNLKA
ncbi:MAG: NAD(P)-binding protein [Candidatus Aenigmarchaeota archaeon]|nr:NAD(P)-binding protein [Candidatus Aenigmarchaeota archaeon]